MKNPREETPWNFCDYRCEVCLYQPTCDLYHRVEVERQVLRLEGKNPDDLGVVLESVANTFTEVIENLQEEARKWGIDLEALSRELEPEEARRRGEIRNDPLYENSLELTVSLMRFIEKRRPTTPESPENAQAWEDLSWHHTLFGAKLARALSGLLERDAGWQPQGGLPDYRVSAGIALESLRKCRNALEVLRSSLPVAAQEIDELHAGIKKLRERAREKFDPLM